MTRTPSRHRRVHRYELVVAAAVTVVFCMAPTVGDVGSCGRQATELNMRLFADTRKTLDCQRCTTCSISTHTCESACDSSAPATAGWPSTCHPLSHDGDVCLRALRAASCADYASFVDDTAPTIPSECDFCHVLPSSGASAGD